MKKSRFRHKLKPKRKAAQPSSQSAKPSRYKRFDGPDYGTYTSDELDAALDQALIDFTERYKKTFGLGDDNTCFNELDKLE